MGYYQILSTLSRLLLWSSYLKFIDRAWTNEKFYLPWCTIHSNLLRSSSWKVYQHIVINWNLTHVHNLQYFRAIYEIQLLSVKTDMKLETFLVYLHKICRWFNMKSFLCQTRNQHYILNFCFATSREIRQWIYK